MKRNIVITGLLLMYSFSLWAGDTDWLIFARSQGGEVVDAVRFIEGGRLYFGEDAMQFVDTEGTTTLSYDGGGYMYFGAENPISGVKEVVVDDASLYYDKAKSEVVLLSEDVAERMWLYSLQGVQLAEVQATSINLKHPQAYRAITLYQPILLTTDKPR